MITICLGVFLLGFILPGTPCTSCTWLTISLPMFRKFSAISSSNIFSDSFSLLSPSGTLIIQMFSSVQFSRSVVSDSLRPHESQHDRPPCPSPTPGVHSDSCPSVMPSSHLNFCHPLLLLPPMSPRIRVFSKDSALRMRWPKYWSFSFSISASNEHPGL